MGLLAFISVVMSLVVAGQVFYGFYFKGEPLLSWKNFFLLGFMQFFTLATLWASQLDFASDIYQPSGEGYTVLAIAMPVFYFAFMLAWAVAKRWKWPEKFVPRADLPVTTTSIMICGGAFALLVTLSIPLVGGSYGDSLIVFCRTNMASAAAGLFFYLVLSNPRNPVWWGLFLPVLLLAIVTSIVGSIDRRNFLSVFFALAWVWYFAKLRHVKPNKAILRIGIIGAITFVCLVTYNSGRHALGWTGATFDARWDQIQQLAKNPDFSRRNIINEILYFL